MAPSRNILIPTLIAFALAISAAKSSSTPTWKARIYPWYSIAGFCNDSYTCSCSSMPSNYQLEIFASTVFDGHTVNYDLGILTPTSASDAVNNCYNGCQYLSLALSAAGDEVYHSCGKRANDNTCYYYARIAYFSERPDSCALEYTPTSDLRCAIGSPVGDSSYVCKGTNSTMPTITTFGGYTLCGNTEDPRLTTGYHAGVKDKMTLAIRNDTCTASDGTCSTALVNNPNNAFLYQDACVDIDGKGCKAAYKQVDWILPSNGAASTQTEWYIGTDRSCWGNNRYHMVIKSSISAPAPSPTPSAPTSTPTPTPSTSTNGTISPDAFASASAPRIEALSVVTLVSVITAVAYLISIAIVYGNGWYL